VIGTMGDSTINDARQQPQPQRDRVLDARDAPMPRTVRVFLLGLLLLVMLGALYLIIARGDALSVDLAKLGRVFCF